MHGARNLNPAITLKNLLPPGRGPMLRGYQPERPDAAARRPPYIGGEKEPIDESPWPDTRVEPQLGRGAGTEVTLAVDALPVDARIAGP